LLRPFFYILLCIASPATATTTTAPAISIKALAEDDYWHTLLHYKQTLFSQQSTVDDPTFLSSEGQTNPTAELKATITAFSTGDPTEESHPINRFPARLNWLQKNLTPEQTARFVATQSSTFEATWNAIEPSAASVIFPAQYMNNREDKIRTLDLSTELLQMNQADGKIDQKTYADRFLTILKQRAPLGKVDDDFYPHTTPPPPNIGHDSSRITTGLGSYDSHEFKQTWNEFRCSLQLFF
jgi:hypothetical protein